MTSFPKKGLAGALMLWKSVFKLVCDFSFDLRLNDIHDVYYTGISNFAKNLLPG